jgi:hypothetical protein
MNSHVKDITGNVYGNLTVISYYGVNRKHLSLWRCKCVCGNEIISNSHTLKIGKQRGCGCVRYKKIKLLGLAKFKHGMSGTRLYRIWKDMRRRHVVCYEWDNFELFRQWVIKNGYNKQKCSFIIDTSIKADGDNVIFVYRHEILPLIKKRIV